MSRFSNDYTKDWKEVQAAAVERAGHRCIRCCHPYIKGQHGKGQWSPCDKLCKHTGPVRIIAGTRLDFPLADNSLRENGLKYCEAEWRILTTHHFNGDKACNSFWNLLVLCQRCHLMIQGKVRPEVPYFFEHSSWLKPYVAGYYAKSYLGLDLTLEETMARLPELLGLECRVPNSEVKA